MTQDKLTQDKLTHDKLTHDNDNPAPPERPPQDTALSLLTMASPAFRFSFLSAGFHRAKWPTFRKKPADISPRTDVTPESDELQEALEPTAAPQDRTNSPAGSDRADPEG